MFELGLSLKTKTLEKRPWEVGFLQKWIQNALFDASMIKSALLEGLQICFKS